MPKQHPEEKIIGIKKSKPFVKTFHCSGSMNPTAIRLPVFFCDHATGLFSGDWWSAHCPTSTRHSLLKCNDGTDQRAHWAKIVWFCLHLLVLNVEMNETRLMTQSQAQSHWEIDQLAQLDYPITKASDQKTTISLSCYW